MRYGFHLLFLYYLLFQRPIQKHYNLSASTNVLRRKRCRGGSISNMLFQRPVYGLRVVGVRRNICKMGRFGGGTTRRFPEICRRHSASARRISAEGFSRDHALFKRPESRVIEVIARLYVGKRITRGRLGGAVGSPEKG